MSDTLNALGQHNLSANVLDAIAHPSIVNPMNAYISLLQLQAFLRLAGLSGGGAAVRPTMAGQIGAIGAAPGSGVVGITHAGPASPSVPGLPPTVSLPPGATAMPPATARTPGGPGWFMPKNPALLQGNNVWTTPSGQHPYIDMSQTPLTYDQWQQGLISGRMPEAAANPAWYPPWAPEMAANTWRDAPGVVRYPPAAPQPVYQGTPQPSDWDYIRNALSYGGGQ